MRPAGPLFRPDQFEGIQPGAALLQYSLDLVGKLDLVANQSAPGRPRSFLGLRKHVGERPHIKHPTEEHSYQTWFRVHESSAGSLAIRSDLLLTNSLHGLVLDTS